MKLGSERKEKGSSENDGCAVTKQQDCDFQEDN